MLNDQKNLETCASITNLPKIEISSICPRPCTICSSIHIDTIHAMRFDQRLELLTISEKIKNDYNITYSISALSRHFKNYRTKLRAITQSKTLTLINNKADQRAKHISFLRCMADSMFVKIQERWHEVPPSVENLEKIMNLLYKTLDPKNDDNDFDMQIKALITNPQQININQLSLFSPELPQNMPDDNSDEIKNNEKIENKK